MKINAVYINVVCFLLLALLPSFMNTFLTPDSRTPGLLVAAMIVFLCLLRYVKFVRVPINWINIIVLILVWILFVPLITGGFNFTSKSLLSLLSLLFLLLFVFLIVVWFERCDTHRLYRLVKIVCGIFIMIGWAGYFFKVKAFGYGAISYIFPFAEPAHFARIAGPIYVIAFFLVPKKFKLIILTNAIIQSILLQSLSLLLYTTIILIIVLQVRAMGFVVPIIFIVVILAAVLIKNPVYLNHFTNRLTLSPERGNLTSLIMLQGVVAAKNSLVNTGGLGLGFQMLGTEEPNEISIIISSILSDGGELNRVDGGTVAAKLIAELGLVGIILAGFVFIQILRSIFCLRRYWRDDLRLKVIWSDYQLKLIITNSLIATFFIEMFLRGGGYFSFTVILFMVSLFYVRKSKVVSSLISCNINN